MVKITYLRYITEEKFWQRDAEKLRGYFANIYRENDLFHNHEVNSKSIYRMPLIQYKVVNNQLMIVGINEGSEIITNEFLKHKRINLGDKTLENFETTLEIKNKELKVKDELFSYKFETIWLPINQKNKIKYEKKELDLNKVLTNNLLTLFKGCKEKADKKIMVKGRFEEKKVKVKNIEMIGFKGDFVSNVKIPEFLSVAKRVSIGFGVVRNN